MPATLTNDRFQIEMSVAAYEFPDVTDDAYDANWLVIGIALQLVYGAWRWRVEDAGALTWELQDCIRWLERLSRGEAVESETCGFSEPDISFETIRNEDGEIIGLTMNLMDEFQPPTKVLIPRENNVVSLRFHTPPDVLRAFAESLSADLAKFPQRGLRPVAAPDM
ncbi:MAG: hypothetical protein K8L97_10365 [Anaerolineae bacterium]|nr:hypothetical protein [Anaerolineae bacterium]